MAQNSKNPYPWTPHKRVLFAREFLRDVSDKGVIKDSDFEEVREGLVVRHSKTFKIEPTIEDLRKERDFLRATHSFLVRHLLRVFPEKFNPDTFALELTDEEWDSLKKRKSSKSNTKSFKHLREGTCNQAIKIFHNHFGGFLSGTVDALIDVDLQDDSEDEEDEGGDVYHDAHYDAEQLINSELLDSSTLTSDTVNTVSSNQKPVHNIKFTRPPAPVSGTAKIPSTADNPTSNNQKNIESLIVGDEIETRSTAGVSLTSAAKTVTNNPMPGSNGVFRAFDPTKKPTPKAKSAAKKHAISQLKEQEPSLKRAKTTVVSKKIKTTSSGEVLTNGGSFTDEHSKLAEPQSSQPSVINLASLNTSVTSDVARIFINPQSPSPFQVVWERLNLLKDREVQLPYGFSVDEHVLDLISVELSEQDIDTLFKKVCLDDVRYLKVLERMVRNYEDSHD